MNKLPFVLLLAMMLAGCGDGAGPVAETSTTTPDIAPAESPVFGQLQPEPTGVIETLPADYPNHWIIVQDASFFHMSDGKFIVVDAASDDVAGRVKGMFNAGFIANFYQAKTRPEFYIVETYRSRGTRGERTEVLTIYDKTSLAPTGEVVIPPKRVSGMPTLYHLQLVDEERTAVIYNFTPATSVSVVDVVNRKFLNEIPIPGCSLVYPMAGRAFASLCTDGTMIGVQIGDGGDAGPATAGGTIKLDIISVKSRFAIGNRWPRSASSIFLCPTGCSHPCVNPSCKSDGMTLSKYSTSSSTDNPRASRNSPTRSRGLKYARSHFAARNWSKKDFASRLE